MSKVSAMQSMREARYAAARASRPATAAAPVSAPSPTRPAAPRPASVPPLEDEASPRLPDALDPAGAAELLTPALVPPAEEEAPAAEALCGHRSMNNRSCRRPAGHPEKNHRYN